MHNEEETKWIDAVKNHGDSVALKKLVDRYQPMIENMSNQYFIASFDRNDWYQEAFFICYQTCGVFDGTSGSRFGSFFKMKFKHHIIDLIRQENAYKRRANLFAEPLNFEELVERIRTNHRYLYEFTDTFSKAIDNMTHSEAICMRHILGNITFEEACETAECDEMTMKQLILTCKKKILKHFDL